MRPAVRLCNVLDEYWTEERCRILELSNSDDDPAVSVARARVAPGVTTRWHRLVDTVERYVMIEGDALVEIGETGPQRIGPGDVVVIPSMIAQRITNAGSRDLVFLAICTPRFSFANYVDIEDER